MQRKREREREVWIFLAKVHVITNTTEISLLTLISWLFSSQNNVCLKLNVYNFFG